MSDCLIAEHSESIFLAEQVECFIAFNLNEQRLRIDFFNILLDNSLLLEDLYDLFFIKIFQIFFTVHFVQIILFLTEKSSLKVEIVVHEYS